MAKLFRRTPVRAWALGCALLSPGWVLAQTATAAGAPLDWRQANAAVGAFARGHADVLRWEQSQPGASSATPQAVPAGALELGQAQAAVRRAWGLHPDLVVAQQQLAPDEVQALASGAFQRVPTLALRRVAELPELLEVAVQARKAWLDAVAARAVLRQQRDALTAAEAADTLGQRMVSVGNWSRLQYAPVQMALAGARMDQVRAEYAAVQAASALARVLRWTGPLEALVLPDALPTLPSEALAQPQAQARLQALQGLLPGAEAGRSRTAFDLAWAAYHAAFALARLGQQEVLPAVQFVSDETLLHYNGMLKSVWDVLTQVRAQNQALAAQANALRDFWRADADLQWVLLGGSPQGFVALGGPGAEAAASGSEH